MEWNEIKKKENVVECECEKTECEWNVQTEYFAKNVKYNVDLHSTSHSECSLDNPGQKPIFEQEKLIVSYLQVLSPRTALIGILLRTLLTKTLHSL